MHEGFHLFSRPDLLAITSNTKKICTLLFLKMQWGGCPFIEFQEPIFAPVHGTNAAGGEGLYRNSIDVFS